MIGLGSSYSGRAQANPERNTVEINTEMVGEESASRFKVYDRPTVHPGNCACCGAVDRPVVDFGVSVDFESTGFGALLLCVTCVNQAASKFNPTTPTTPVLSDEEIAELRKDFSHALDNHIGYLRDISADLRASSSSGGTAIPNDSTDERSESEADRVADDANESVSEPGPFRISSSKLGSAI